MAAVVVRVEVDVGEGASVGVLGVANAGDLQPREPVGEYLLVVRGLFAETAYGLVSRTNPREQDG